MSWYFYHVRKTGGRAIIHCFLQSVLKTDEKDAGGSHIKYKELCDKHIINLNNKKIVCHNMSLIKNSDYYFGFSHYPQWQIGNMIHYSIGFTCIRDPCSRFISYYNDMLQQKERFKNTEAKYIDLPFVEFVDKVEKKHLLSTLYMFSKNYNVEEAFNNITDLAFVFFQDTLKDDLAKIGMDIYLEPIAVHKKLIDWSDLKGFELTHLLNVLKPEIDLYNKLLDWRKENSENE